MVAIRVVNQMRAATGAVDSGIEMFSISMQLVVGIIIGIAFCSMVCYFRMRCHVTCIARYVGRLDQQVHFACWVAGSRPTSPCDHGLLDPDSATAPSSSRGQRPRAKVIRRRASRVQVVMTGR